MMPPVFASEPKITVPSAARSIGGFEIDHQKFSALAIRLQRAAILAHCADMTYRLGRPVSLDEAARDWIPAKAEIWRTMFNQRIAARLRGQNPTMPTAGLA